MRILLLNQFFWPDSAATSQFLTDLACHLSDQGHDVTVICGPSGYAVLPPQGPQPPVKIIRTRTLPFARGTLSRVFSYMSFAAAAIWDGFLAPCPDVVVTLTTPPLLSLAGTLFKTFRGVRHFVWEMDVYPDVAVALEVLKPGSMLTRLIGFLSDFSRKHADGVVVLGECMRDLLVKRGIPRSKIRVSENWADGTVVSPMPSRGDGKLRVVYSGNLGLAHDVETVCGAIDALAGDDRFEFYFYGDGVRRKPLQEWCSARNIGSVAFRPYQPKNRLRHSIGSGDIGLVCLRHSCTGTVVPSKTYTLLAAGKPILFIGSRTATPARIIEKHACGWQIDTGDVPALIALLRTLAVNPHMVHRAGENARQAFLRYYDLPGSVTRLSGIFGAESVDPLSEVLETAASAVWAGPVRSGQT